MPPKKQNPIVKVVPEKNDADLDLLADQVKHEVSEEEPEPEENKLEKPKAKRVMSDKQIEVLALGRAKGRERLNAKHAEINQHKEEVKATKLSIKEQKAIKEQELIEALRVETENKIVSKALSIKKKQIKKEAVLAEISDDETPMEEIKSIAKTIKKPTPVKKAVIEPVQKLPQPQYQNNPPIHLYHKYQFAE